MPRTVLRRAPGKRAGGLGLGGGDPVAGIGRIGVAAIAIVGLQGVADHVVAGQQLTPGCHGKQVRVVEAHAGVEVGDHHVGVPKRDAPGGLDIDRRGNRAARRSQVPLPYGRAAAGYAVGRHGVFDVAFPRQPLRQLGRRHAVGEKHLRALGERLAVGHRHAQPVTERLRMSGPLHAAGNRGSRHQGGVGFELDNDSRRAADRRVRLRKNWQRR